MTEKNIVRPSCMECETKVFWNLGVYYHRTGQLVNIKLTCYLFLDSKLVDYLMYL